MAPSKSPKRTSGSSKRGGGEKKVRRTKVKSDVKRPKSAYLFFAIERRQSLIKEKPELASKVTEISKLLGDEWRRLEDSEKAKYNDMAEADRKRYTDERDSKKSTSAE